MSSDYKSNLVSDDDMKDLNGSMDEDEEIEFTNYVDNKMND